MEDDAQYTDKNIKIWKMKKLIKSLEPVRSSDTSLISLIMHPQDQIARVTRLLDTEIVNSSVIKSGSELSAITSAQQRLKLYNMVPPNGLVLYTGIIMTEDGKENKVTVDFEPFKPIYASSYLCDNKFHTEALIELLESDNKFGFIVVDRKGILFGTLSGKTCQVLQKFAFDLQQMHHVRKTAELATQFYINPATGEPNVDALILAGSARFKTELGTSGVFDPRLQDKILDVVHVSVGGEKGFNQAIELSAVIRSNLGLIQEIRLIRNYFKEITQDTGKYVCGLDDTLKALEMGAVETLIVWENLDINRYVLKNSTSCALVVKHLNKEQGADQSNFLDSDTSTELEVHEKTLLLEWFANEYSKFGCRLEFVSDKSDEGLQFCIAGFSGIGGILRHQLDDIKVV